MITLQTIEERLNKLREEYLTASPSRRKTLTLIAKPLLSAKRVLEKKLPPQQALPLTTKEEP